MNMQMRVRLAKPLNFETAHGIFTKFHKKSQKTLPACKKDCKKHAEKHAKKHVNKTESIRKEGRGVGIFWGESNKGE